MKPPAPALSYIYNIKTMHAKLNKILAFSLMAAAAASAHLQAQDYSSTGTEQLRDEANKFIGDGQYILARPLLEVLVSRFEQLDDKSQLEHLYFFLGYSYVQEYMGQKSATYLEQAIPYFDKILQMFPGGERAAKSIELKATCLNGLGKFEQAAETWAMSLNSPYVEKLNNSERFAITKKVAQAFYNMKSWEKGEKWFEAMFNTAPNVEDKTFAAVALIRSAFAAGDFDRARKYYSYTTNKVPSRYDIALSVDFMQAGDKLVGEEKFPEASLCYTFVLTKDEIIDFFKSYKARLESQISRIRAVNPGNPRIKELEMRVQYADAMIKGVSEVKDYSPQMLARKARNYFLTKRNYESYWAYRQLLDAYPEDPMIEDFYYAAFICAKEIGKESQLDKIGTEYREKFPDGKYSREIAIQFALFLLEQGEKNPLQKERFFEVAKQAVEQNPEDENTGKFIFLLGKTWLTDKNYAELRSYMKDFAAKHPDANGADGALYWPMLSYLMEFDYENAFKFADELLKKHPESEYAEDAEFRRAVSVFGDGQISDARKYFAEFLEKYKPMGSKLAGEAELFLGDISFMEQEYEDSYNHYMAVPDIANGVQKTIDAAFFQCATMLETAEQFDRQAEVLKRYIKEYPEGNSAMANFLISKPLLKQGLSADAVQGYMDSISKYGNDFKNDSVDKIIEDFPKFYAEAKTQMDATAAFLQKTLSDDAFLKMLVNDPGKRYQYTVENPDVNPLVYALFKVQSLKGDKEAVFGQNVLKDKAPIQKLLDVYKAQQAKFPKISPEQFFERELKAAREAKNKVLENRMLMALDSIGKLKERPGMFVDADFKNMPFKVIVWMGKSNEKYSIESARKALDFVIESDSDYRLDALFAMADIEERNSNYEEARILYKKAEDDFPLDAMASKAALKQAEMDVKLGKIESAREKYNSIVALPDWRGPVHAEAYYRLGMLEKEQGNSAMAILRFDTCAINFADCLDFAGKAVLQGAQLSMSLGQTEKAKEFCDTFLAEESNEESPEYKAIKEYRDSIR